MRKDPMANGLVKWWRARFFAGYRPFSVVGTNTEGSDSEELLTAVPATSNVSSSPPPPPTASPPTPIPIAAAEQPQVTVDGPATCTATEALPTGNDVQEQPPTCATTKQLSFEVKIRAAKRIDPQTGQIYKVMSPKKDQGKESCQILCIIFPRRFTTHLYLMRMEFICDVSVAEGDRRQKFSFTLYDVDSHGKITKDDVASLVTTIYEILSTSMKVPPWDSKMIKVQLTVSPDQRASITSSSGQQQSRNVAANNGTSFIRNCVNATVQAQQTVSTASPAQHHNPSSSCCHLTKHAAPCNHTTTATRTAVRHGMSRVPRRRRAPRYRCVQTERKEVETHSEDDDENARTNRVLQEEVRKRVGPVPHLPSPYSNSSEGDVSDDSGDTSPAFSPLTPLLTTNQRKRSGALQRQQLLEIIQANMEKNNLSFHTTRKRHQNEQRSNERVPSHGPHLETPNYNNVDCQAPSVEPCQMTTTYHKMIRESSTHHHNTSFPKTPVKSRSNLRKTRHSAPRNNVTPKNNVTHSASKVYTTYPHTLLNRNVIVPTTAYNEIPQHVATSGANTQHRNIVNLAPNNNQQTPNHQTVTNNHNNVQRSNDAQFLQSPQQQQQQQQQQCGRTTKKHLLKHATREQDQARAMAQVVRWLEREFSQNAVAATSGRRHVHEHIHHHYHHYHAEALV